LNHLKIKSAKQDKSLQQENAGLMDELNNLNHQYAQVFKKFELFQQADASRYKEIWKMNEEEARVVMERILMADKIIHTQQLGMEWQGPKEDLFKDVDPSAFKGSPIEFGEDVKERYNGSLASQYLEHKSQSENVKKALTILCEEAGFLVL
jgi:dynein regulatory complex protein 1